MLPLTYQWDMISNKGELAKGGWAGQLLYDQSGQKRRRRVLRHKSGG